MKQTFVVLKFLGCVLTTEIVRAQDEIPVTLQYRLVEGIVQISKPGEESELVIL